MSGMSYNWEEIKRISSVLSTSNTTLTDSLKTVDDTVQTMGQNWSGASWDAFKTYYDNYKKNVIDPLASDISSWVSNLSSLASSASETQTNNTKLFQ